MKIIVNSTSNLTECIYLIYYKSFYAASSIESKVNIYARKKDKKGIYIKNIYMRGLVQINIHGSLKYCYGI